MTIKPEEWTDLMATTDAEKWAVAFNGEYMVIPKDGWPDRAVAREYAMSVMIGWFANAMTAAENATATIFKAQLAEAGQARMLPDEDEEDESEHLGAFTRLASRVAALERAVAAHNHASLSEAHRVPRGDRDAART